jgi:hypothetical protein
MSRSSVELGRLCFFAYENGKVMVKIFAIIFIFICCFISCKNKSSINVDSEKPNWEAILLQQNEMNKPIIKRGNVTEEIKVPITEEEVYGFVLTNDDVLKYLNEDVFFGLNTDPSYYIDNEDYLINYEHFEEEPELGIMQDTDLMTATNDYIEIEFANNMLINVTIKKKTGQHFLGMFIGEDVNDIITILGDDYWHQDNAYIYHGLNRIKEIHHSLQIITAHSTSNIIDQLSFGINGILSNGLLPKNNTQ